MESMTNYPGPRAHTSELSNGRMLSLPAVVVPGYVTASRQLDQVNISIRMLHSFVGSIQCQVRINTTSSTGMGNWYYTSTLTWQPAVVVPVPMLDPVAPTPLVVGSVNAPDIVSFGSSGQLALSDIVLGAPDMLRVDFHAYGSVQPESVSVMAVDTMTNYPTLYPVRTLVNGTWLLQARVVSKHQLNLPRAVTSLNLAIAVGDSFVGTMLYTVRLTTVNMLSNRTSEWTHQDTMTWQAAPSIAPPVHVPAVTPLTVASVDANKSIAFNTTAFIRLRNVSFGALDQLTIEFVNAFTLATPQSVSFYAVQAMAKYPLMPLLGTLTQGPWIVPPLSLPQYLNQTRVLTSLTVSVQMPPSFVGMAQFSIRLSTLSPTQLGLSYVYRAKMTWQGPPSSVAPVIHPVLATRLVVGSVKPSTTVAFNTSAIIQLFNVSFGVSDALSLDVRVGIPARAINVMAVESTTNYA
ncbi:hypothetical protein As57867_005314, partial [Aphanomyces stellatus]